MARVAIPQVQNLLTRSEDLSHAAWNANSAITITPNNATAPDGTTTAALQTPNGGVSRHYSAQAITVPGAYQIAPRRMSYSCFVKGGAATQWYALGDDRHTSFVYAWFDVTNGLVGTVTADNDTGISVVNRIYPASSYFASAPAGWWRIEMTYIMVSPSGGAGMAASSLLVGPTTANGTQSYDSAAGVTGWAWGAQMTGGANWTGPYQRTVAAAVNTGSIRSLP